MSSLFVYFVGLTVLTAVVIVMFEALLDRIYSKLMTMNQQSEAPDEVVLKKHMVFYRLRTSDALKRVTSTIFGVFYFFLLVFPPFDLR